MDLQLFKFRFIIVTRFKQVGSFSNFKFPENILILIKYLKHATVNNKFYHNNLWKRQN